MRLGELQRLFWAIATREQDGPRIEPSDVFVDTARLDAAARMHIYANMYVWRQIDALREDFPALAAVMGDDPFRAFAEAYVRACPSTHHSLSRLGQHVATFLTERPGGRPDLRDLAALEWARVEVFEELAVAVALPETLREIAAADFSTRSLRVVPALRLLRLDHDVLAVWQEIEDELPPSEARPQLTFAAVWRKEFDVFHVRLEPDEARALERAVAGEPLGTVCEAFADRLDAVQAAFRAIGSWFSEGWIADAEERNP